MDTIGKRLKYLRKLRKETQKDVADATGINRGNISHYENDDVGVSNVVLNSLAKHFNIRIEWLEKGEGEIPSPGIVQLSFDNSDNSNIVHLKNLLKDFISENFKEISDTELLAAMLKDEKITMLAEQIKKDRDQYSSLEKFNKIDDILSVDEKGLISLYRELDVRSKIKVEGYIEGLLSTSFANQKQTLYTYAPGDEDAAAEESGEYNIKKA